MDLLRVAFVIGFLFVMLLEQIEGRKEIPDAEIQEGQIYTGHFTIPQKVIEDEIYRQTGQGKVCDAEIRETLLERDTEWKISVKVGHVATVPGSPNIKPYSYVEMKIYREDVSLDLAYYTTRSIHHKAVIVVDRITYSDGVITVKRGGDYLVLNIELGEDCRQDMRGITPQNMAMSSLESWYSRNTHLQSCGINGWPQSVCDHVIENLCGLQKVDGDICFKNIHEGYSCGISMNIISMIGVFREKSLIIAKTPLKSVSGYYFNGSRHMGIVYPCLYDEI